MYSEYLINALADLKPIATSTLRIKWGSTTTASWKLRARARMLVMEMERKCISRQKGVAEGSG